MRAYRPVSIIATVILLASILASSRSAGARAIYQGSIQIHAHVCPAGALELSTECTQKRGPMGVMIAIDDSLPKAMDGTGHVSFDDLVAGDHLVVVRVGPYAERFGQMRASCSNSVTGIYPSPVSIAASDEPRFRVQVAPRSQLTCEMFFIP